MVLEAPIMTKCSHLVCGHCFRGWVQRQREIATRKSVALDVVSGQGVLLRTGLCEVVSCA